MLVLTRRVHEKIMIGDDITVTILAVQDENVRIGVAAPRDVAVDREEIRRRKMVEGVTGRRRNHGHADEVNQQPQPMDEDQLDVDADTNFNR